MFKLYDKVKIKRSGKTGFVVLIDDDKGRKPPIYFIEISQEEKLDSDEENLIWLEEEDLEIIKR
ncbi:MAG: hypothetical protein KH366_20050 [Clostridiaceae bacterium]|nr:hypothetical protein [Clostridiaceae bacterium]